MVRDMMAEFDRYAADDGVTVTTDGSVRSYDLRGRVWRPHWVRDGDGVSAPAARATGLAGPPLSKETLAQCRAAGAEWLGLAAAAGSAGGLALTAGPARFLG